MSLPTRKRRSDTAVVNAADAVPMEQNTDPNLQQPQVIGPKLRVRIRRIHGVARWTWNAGSEDEVCGICQSAFEGVAPVPGRKFKSDCLWCTHLLSYSMKHCFFLFMQYQKIGVKYPGDECPVVWGKCGHAFHLQCVSTWLNSSRNTCPICRREWEFGQSNEIPRRNSGND